jgi:hypothetical protein
MRAVIDHPLFGYRTLFTETMDVLLEEIVRFKSEAFKVEQEWRAVVRQREFLKQGTDDGGKTPLPVHFRTGRGTLGVRERENAPQLVGELSHLSSYK